MDIENYSAIVKQYQTYIQTICFMHLKRSEVAEDIAQETFVKAYHKIGELKNLEMFKPWLARIAVNLCLDYLKQNKECFVSLEEESVADILQDLSDTENFNSEHEYILGVHENDLYRALYSVDYEKRTVLALFYLYDFSIKVIAKRLSITESAVKKRLERARLTLQEKVNEMKTNTLNEKEFSDRIIELIKKPSLLEQNESPVNLVWKEICKHLNDYKIIEGEELISKKDHESLNPVENCIKAVEVDKARVLRAHTTTVIMNFLQKNSTAACKIMTAGRVWRETDEDKTHLKMFHQADVLILSENTKEGDLLTSITNLLEAIIPEAKIKWRVGNFPYTKRGWVISVEKDGKELDLIGAGEMKDDVLQSYGVDTSKMKAIAYGIGLERLAMIKFGLDSIHEATKIKI